MKLYNFLFFTVISCSAPQSDDMSLNALTTSMEKELTTESILSALDNSVQGNYGEFINLEHGYFELANCRLTLFKDGNEWALVFEKFGYNARAGDADGFEINFFGNCLQNLKEYNGETSNIDFVGIDNDIYEVLQKQGDTITIRGQKVAIPKDMKSYSDLGIKWGYDNKNYEGAVLKYLAEKYPQFTRASDEEVRRCLPENLKKIMTIDDWYQEEYHQFAQTVPPSKQKTFQMIAKVLVTGDTKHYKPTEKSNTHWSNWPESGGM